MNRTSTITSAKTATDKIRFRRSMRLIVCSSSSSVNVSPPDLEEGNYNYDYKDS
jgi:hypothetical protein